MHCPSHDDETPSLSITERDGHVLVKCHAGCSQAAVLDVLRARGLWPVRDDPHPHGLTVAELAAAKRLPEDFLRDLGLHDTMFHGAPIVAIPYYDADGNEMALRYRRALNGAERFFWRRGARLAPYGMQRLRDARKAGWLLLVEGESDCWTCWNHGLSALGIPGKATWREEWARLLDGLDVVLWQEPDAADLVGRVAQDVPGLRVIRAPDGVKDVSEAHIRGLDVREVIEPLRATARSGDDILREIAEEQRRRAAEEALPRARELLDTPDLIARVEAALEALGLAGDKLPALAVYLALSSRLLDRPVNIVVEGPSAAGKTFLVETVLRLFPASAVYKLTASSERALVYTDADLRHRVLVIGEAAGLHHDGVGATVMRSIAWEGRFVYDTVEKTRDGLRSVRIDKPGPTGVITTTVKPLEAELATRFLSVPIRDDPAQTREVLRETGRRYAEGAGTPDLRAFLQAQQWLEGGGARQVTVPFAKTLAGLVDPGVVRVRRDFPQALALVQASALLYQRQRPRDPHGRIVATVEDYKVVHRLASRLFPEPGGLTDAQREAVEAVRKLYDETKVVVSYQQVANRLGIDQSAAYRRLQKPLTAGFVINDEEKPRRPARLRPGETPPEPRPALPDPEALLRAPGGVRTSPETDCRPADPGPKSLEIYAPGSAVGVCSVGESSVQTVSGPGNGADGQSAEDLQEGTADPEAVENADSRGQSAGLHRVAGVIFTSPTPADGTPTSSALSSDAAAPAAPADGFVPQVVLNALDAGGVTLNVAGGQLVIRTLSGRIPPARLTEVIAEYRAALWEVVAAPCPACGGTTWWFSSVGGPMCANCWPCERSRKGSRQRSLTPITNRMLPWALEQLTGGLVHQIGETVVDGAQRFLYEMTDVPEPEAVFAMARKRGFPMLCIGRGETIVGGEAAWRMFCARATKVEIARAVAAMMALDTDTATATAVEPAPPGSDGAPEDRG